MSSQILVTGATGFIGRQLVRDLAAAGHEVRVLVRNREKAEALFGESVEIASGDLCDPGSLRAACRGIDLVYHIGGIYRFGLRHRREVWETNVTGTESLLQASAAAGVSKMVYLSSGGLMKAAKSRASKSTPFRPLLTEEDFPASPPPFSSYKGSKWHAEMKVLEWARRGFPAVIASPTCPIGAEDELPTPTGQIVSDFLAGRFPFYCRTGLNFIAVDELSQGLQRVAARGRIGERYLLGHHNLWLKHFLDILAEETGLRAPRVALPFWAVCLAGCGGEVVDLFQTGDRPARVCLESALQSGRIQFFSNAKAREELGWNPKRPIRDSIREAIAWSQNSQNSGRDVRTSPDRRLQTEGEVESGSEPVLAQTYAASRSAQTQVG